MQVRKRLDDLYNYAKYSAPFHRGNRYYFYKNDGLQNQSVLYVQEGIAGTTRVLIDPNILSADGTTKLSQFELSMDGSHAVFGLSKGGSDWEEFHVLETATKKTLDETLLWVKVSDIAWSGDGFYYSRYDAPAPGHELVGSNEKHKVYFHKLGTPQNADVLVYSDPAHPHRFHTVSTTRDERFVILNISDRGTGKKGNALFYRDSIWSDQTFKPLIPQISDDQYRVIDNIGEQLLIQTNRKAPNDRIICMDPTNAAEGNWKEVVAEQPEALTSASMGGDKLFTVYLKDVTSRVIVRDSAGTALTTVELPAPGTVGGFAGLTEDKEIFYSFTSFLFPPTIYRYELASGKSTLFRAVEIPHFKAEAFVTSQVFYKSKDGSSIPMFLVHRRDLKLDGHNPTLLYGYGGFNITLTPGFSSLRLALLEKGFVFAQANLRGGGEYGEQWHETGTVLRKQNVFDDFTAAAQWLIANRYTSPSRLAIQGGSNGGLLVGAVANQHPELFAAVIAQVGVMDMLRFQKFTIGWNWIPDYGSSDDPEQFKALYAYSPLHNIQTSGHYPPVLITTADHDDRVVQAHSSKYAATLQEKAKGGPFLICIDTNSGHGASNVSKVLDENADVQTFLFHNLGVTPSY